MIERIPPLTALRAFITVARLGSLSEAAKALHLTHGAVSHQIRAIEDMLGQTLLIRQGRGMALTEAGRSYAYQVRPLLEELAAASAQVGDKSAQSTLVLSVLPSWVMHWLLPRLPDWRHQFPHIHLKLRAGLAFSDLEGDHMDAAIRFGQGHWPHVQVRRLMGEGLVVVASPDLCAPALQRKPVDWRRWPCMHVGESWATWMAAAGLDGEVTAAGLHFTDSTHLLEAARLGQGVALTRRSIAQALLARGELVLVHPVQAPHPDAYYLVSPHRAKVKPELSLFKDWLSVQIKQYEKDSSLWDAQQGVQSALKRVARAKRRASS